MRLSLRNLAVNGWRRRLWAASSFCLLATSSLAAAPTISNVSQRGLQPATPQTLVIEGAELDGDSKLVTNLPLDSQQLQPGSAPNRVTFSLQVAAHASPGPYSVRVSNAKGVSNAVYLAVDKLPQTALSERTASLPAALLGALAGDARPRTTFAGLKGQTVVAEVECQRLGGSFRPVVRLYDSRGVQVAWSGPQRALSGDARLTATLPTDGDYVIEVHDVLYRAAGPGYFRLKLGTLAYANAAFPNAVTRGTNGPVELRSGNFAPGTRIEFDARNLTTLGAYPAPWNPLNATFALTGAPPTILVTDIPESLEPAEPPQGNKLVGPAPLAVHGRLARPGEEDRIAIPVTPGSKLQIELQAQRWGSPLDGVLSVLGPAGNTLANNDDRPGTSDPAVELTVPGDVNQLAAVFRDLEGRGGEDYVYRLVVRDLNRPDLSLALESDRVNIPAGGAQLLTIPVTRQGNPGAIRFELPGLPAGVVTTGLELAPTSDLALISLAAPPDAPTAAALTTLIARASVGEPPVARTALAAENPASRVAPWLRQELAVAITSAAPLNVTWVAGAPDEKLALGGKLAVQAQVGRAAGLTGAVRLRLVTNQRMPKKTVKMNNQDVQVDDVDRALRLEGTPTLNPDQNSISTTILVPADLPAGVWNLAIIAEALSADGKTVTHSAATPVRSLTAGN